MQPATADKATTVPHKVLLLLVVVLGVGLRLNNYETESVYWDEFSSLIHLKPPAGYADSPHFQLWDHAVIRNQADSLMGFWQRNRELDPATMPLYYTFEYLVWNYGGQSVPVLRLLSIAFGLLAFPFIYLLGRRLWGPTAGLVALFLFAASPIHVQFAQEIRMYSLFGALAAASAYSFVRLVQDGGRWWGINFFVNVLLLWTHPFAVWLPFVEGLTLLLCFWNRPRLVLTWGFGHVALLVPSAIYISTIQFFAEDTTSDWLNIPGWRVLIADIFADDFIGLTPQLFGRPDALLRVFPESFALWLSDSKKAIGILGALFFIALAVGCARLALQRFRESGATRERDGSWRWLMFLLLWALLPPLILITLSHLWRPMIFPRYTLHCSIAFYLLAGGGIAAIKNPAFRVVPIAALVLLYAYQNALVIAGPHRTDWNAASQHLREQAAEQDLILVHNWLWKRVFTYSMGPAPQPIGYAADFDALAEQARTWLDGAYPDPGSNTRPGLWVVIQNGYFNMAPAFDLERELAARGMTWKSRFFVGIEGLWVYQVLDDPGRVYNVTAPLSDDFSTAFHDLSNELWFHGDYRNAICIAERGIDYAPQDPRMWAYMAMSLKELGETRAAAAAFEQSLKINRYEYPWSLTNLGECYLELGRPVAAMFPLKEAMEQLPDDVRPRWLMAEALIAVGRPWDAVSLLMEKLDSQHWEENHWRVLQHATQEWLRLTEGKDAR